jgi:hypothetical protein
VNKKNAQGKIEISRNIVYS